MQDNDMRCVYKLYVEAFDVPYIATSRILTRSLNDSSNISVSFDSSSTPSQLFTNRSNLLPPVYVHVVAAGKLLLLLLIDSSSTLLHMDLWYREEGVLL